MGITLSSADLDAAIISRLLSLGKEQKAAVLNMIEAFSQVPDADHWDDPEFVAEMERRDEDYKAGRNTISCSTVEEAMEYLSGRKKV